MYASVLKYLFRRDSGRRVFQHLKIQCEQMCRIETKTLKIKADNLDNVSTLDEEEDFLIESAEL